MERYKNFFVIIICAFLLSPDLLLGASFEATDQYQSDWSILNASGQCILLAGGVSGGGRVSGRRVRGSRQVHGRGVQGSEQVSGGRVTGAGKVGGQKIKGSQQVHGYSVQGSGQVSSGRLIGTGAEDEARQGEGQDDADKECKNLAHAIEMANLSTCVYNANCKNDKGLTPEMSKAGWHEVKPEEVGLTAEELDNGAFKATVYRSPSGDYVLSFAGTDDLGDWLEDFGQGLLGWTTSQYSQAIKISKKLKRNLGAAGEKLTITGHSLGGGLATAAALATDSQAVVFNPAALHPDVAAANNLPYSKADEYVTMYHVEGEILTSAQDMGPIWISVYGVPVKIDGPSAPGKRIPLAPNEQWVKNNVQQSWLDFLGVYKARRMVALHLMDAVMAALKQKYKRECGDER